MTFELILLTVTLGVLWYSFQFGWWRPSIKFEHPRILMYNMVTNHKPKARFNKLRVEPDEFAKQLKWLVEDGWTFVFMSELARPFGQKEVAITFDDGYRDNLLIADPLLKKYGAKATLYLVVDRHDRDWSVTKKQHHNDGELMQEPKLLDADVETMLESGRWELGGHTLTHANLAKLEDGEKAAEIANSKRQLEHAFHVSIDSFAYPFGIFGGEDLRVVRNSGYSSAVTTEEGISTDVTAERYSLRRVKISGNDGMFAFRLRMRTGKCRF